MSARLNGFDYPTGTLLGEVRPWLEHRAALNHQLSTLRFLYRAFAVFSAWMLGEQRVSKFRDVHSTHLSAYAASLARRDLKISTQENYLQTVKSYFAWLESTGRLFDNPARLLVVPRKVRRLQRVPSESEMAQVIDGIDGREPHDDLDRALLEVAYGAGLRLGELHGLQIGSIDVAGQTVRVFGKGAKERVVPLTGCAIRAVQRYMRRGRKALLKGRPNSTHLWIGRDGTPISFWTVRKHIEERGRRVGVKLCPHDLRRAFATHLLLRGISPAVLKELLGHATYSHLKEYLRYAPVELQAIHGKAHPGK